MLPNFEGYSNIAFCPQNISSSVFCYLFRKSGGPPSRMEGNVTYLPLFAGHLYIMYDSQCQSEKKVNYFESEEDMKKYLITQMGSPRVYPYPVNAQVDSGKWWVPHLTPAITYVQPCTVFEESSGYEPDFFNVQPRTVFKESSVYEQISFNVESWTDFEESSGFQQVPDNGSFEESKGTKMKEKGSKEILKLKGGCPADMPKKVLLDDVRHQQLLCLVRSMQDTLATQKEHQQCKLPKQNVKNNACDFCLVRSFILRFNATKGRKELKPMCVQLSTA